jgi:hypothetical protein
MLFPSSLGERPARMGFPLRISNCFGQEIKTGNPFRFNSLNRSEFSIDVRVVAQAT